MQIQTMFVLLFAGFVSTAALLVAYTRGSLDFSLRMHLLAIVLFCAAYVAYLARIIIPEPASELLGALFSFSGLCIETFAMVSVIRPLNAHFINLTIAQTIAAYAIFAGSRALPLTVNQWMVTYTVSYGSFFPTLAWQFLKPPAGGAGKGGNSGEAAPRSRLRTVIGICYLVVIASLLGRIVDALLPARSLSLYSSTPLQVFFYLGQFLFMILGGAGLILLTKVRTDRRLETAATRDSLTGVLNRRSFDEALRKAVAVAGRHDFPFALVMFDFDNFKEINDSLGHHAGDAVLCDFAAAMEKEVRNYDIFGRHGGDEFILLLMSVDEQRLATIERRLAARIESIRPAGLSYTVSAGSVLVDAETGRGIDPERLTIACDLALYEAKRAGRGRMITMVYGKSFNTSLPGSGTPAGGSAKLP
jgi:diguanylate cyclase (GGDEF)-like protein